ncbi:MAG: zinc-ribbon domain-containing protein [Candidatus Hodarchaeales archaeon]
MMKKNNSFFLFIVSIFISLISLVTFFVFNFPLLLLFLFFPPFIFSWQKSRKLNNESNLNIMKRQFCNKCGKKTDESWLFCPYCSEELSNF